MALVNLKDVLDNAYQRRYAVGSFNVVNMEFLEAIIEAAEAKKSPAILAIAEVHFKYVNLENITPAIKEVARRASVPLVLHLDHGESFEAIMRALRAGFTSIMFDGSTLPFEENVARTAEVVKMCHAIGVTVEAELGHVGGAEGAPGGDAAHEALYTKVEQAVEFVKRTCVDALAVAIGTAHGLYRGTPRLDFHRLSQINEAVRIPLVLHGGTGLSVEDFRRAISLGVAKINFYTGMSVAACKTVRDTLESQPQCIDYPGLLKAGKEAIRRTVEEQMEIFMSANICDGVNPLCAVCSGCYVRKSAAELDNEQLIKKITEATVRALRDASAHEPEMKGGMPEHG
jgi:fructose-bisphosphate aldolase class II